MTLDPWTVAAVPGGELRILVGTLGDTTDARAPLDFEVSIGDRRYLGTFATLDQLRGLMEGCGRTGEALSGGYLWIADLVIVSELSLEHLVDVVGELIRSREIEGALTLVER